MTQESHRRIKLLINAVREIEEFDFPFKVTSFSAYPASSINAAIVKIAFFSVAGKSPQAFDLAAPIVVFRWQAFVGLFGGQSM